MREKARSRRMGIRLRWMCVPAFLMLFMIFMVPFLYNPQWQWNVSSQADDQTPTLPLRAKPGENHVQALINAIRTATAAAAAVKNMTFSDLDVRAWKEHNPCSARTELGLRYARRPNAKILDPNVNWDKVLEEYSALHRTCMNSVGNVPEYFLSGAAHTNCKFLIMEIQGVGIGNKIGLFTSAILYAVLTQRVILVNGYSYIPWVMCEPFLGSNWLLDGHFPLPDRHGWETTLLGRWSGYEDPIWKSSAFFGKGVDLKKAGRDAPPAFAVKVDHSHPEVTRFYCNTEQAYLTEATWVHFTGCLYFLPKLFAVPAFRPVLESLFPDPSLALTYLLRTLMIPNDGIWEQVKQQDNALFANVDRRVGIQVRFLYGRKVYFKSASKRANKHVIECATENNILPHILQKGSSKNTENIAQKTPQVTQVFVASLHRALSEELLERYTKHESVNGNIVRVAQLTNRETQQFSVNEDNIAMVEIILLSLVDDLLVTPLSTFGGLAQAYGAIIPWFLEVKSRWGSSCVRAQTVDICYQKAKSHYNCRHDSDVGWNAIQNVVPYIRTCLPIEESDGVQLVSPPMQN